MSKDKRGDVQEMSYGGSWQEEILIEFTLNYFTSIFIIQCMTSKNDLSIDFLFKFTYSIPPKTVLKERRENMRESVSEVSIPPAEPKFPRLNGFQSALTNCTKPQFSHVRL